MTPSARRAADRDFALRAWANLTYAAEHRAGKRTWRSGVPTILPIEGRRFLERVIRENRLASVTLTFYRGRPGRGWAHYEERSIAVSSRAVTRVTMLHELAHVETPDDRGHGVAFRSVYLGLCREYEPRYAASLAAAFRYYDLTVREM